MSESAVFPQSVEALHAHLCELVAEQTPPRVAEVVRVFLEVSSLPCEEMLWSLAFAFDEDHGRIARLEALFTKRSAPSADDVRGFEVHILLPKFLPAHAPGESAGTDTTASGKNAKNLIESFVRALSDMGAYRVIENIDAVSATVYLV